ncbi:MAG: VWA domain-containing protein [Acidobacteriia bacterium]|nr:VWA domain-containing protein [Terriglobia bacterium]
MLSRRDFGLAFGIGRLLRAQVAIQPRKKPGAPEEEQRRPNLRVDTNLMLVPVTVCDPMNRPVTGLEKDNFRILDENVEQTITHFAMDDEPVAVGLVFDVSGSMADKLRRSRMAASAFFSLANPEDEFFLVQFDSSPKMVVPLTRDVEQILNQLTFTRSRGSTALVDAVVLALHEAKKSKKSRKALLIISDGGENNSRYSDVELRDMVREADALIYAIGIYGGARTPEESSGPYFLRQMAEQSGGHALAGDPAELPDIAAKIGMELRNRYILGYYPTSRERDGRYHLVHVRVVPPRGLPTLHAFWRRGYYAPSD